MTNTESLYCHSAPVLMLSFLEDGRDPKCCNILRTVTNATGEFSTEEGNTVSS